MKKKFLTFVMSVCLLLPSLFALTACGEEESTKIAETAWKTCFENIDRENYAFEYDLTVDNVLMQDTQVGTLNGVMGVTQYTVIDGTPYNFEGYVTFVDDDIYMFEKQGDSYKVTEEQDCKYTIDSFLFIIDHLKEKYSLFSYNEETKKYTASGLTFNEPYDTSITYNNASYEIVFGENYISNITGYFYDEDGAKSNFNFGFKNSNTSLPEELRPWANSPVALRVKAMGFEPVVFDSTAEDPVPLDNIPILDYLNGEYDTKYKLGIRLAQDCAIENLIIPEGIYGIFEPKLNCKYTNLKTITLPTTFTHIGSKGFKEIKNVEKFTIAETLQYLANDAVYGSLNLGELIINNQTLLNNKTIKNSGFMSIANQIYFGDDIRIIKHDTVSSYVATKISFPGKLEEYESGAVLNCDKLAEIVVRQASGNNKYTTRVFDYDLQQYVETNTLISSTTIIMLGCQGSKLEYITSQISKIESYAFSGAGIKNISITSNGRIVIESNAFYNCSQLHTLTLPQVGRGNDSPSEDELKFNYIFDTVPNSLKTLIFTKFEGRQSPYDMNLAGAENVENLVTHISSGADYAFHQALQPLKNSLKTLTICAKYNAFMSANLFLHEFTKLTTVKFDLEGKMPSVESPYVTDIYFSKNITGEFYTANDLPNLENFYIDSENTQYKVETGCVIDKTNNKLVYGLKNAVIPEGVTTIGYKAFDKKVGLTSINIPASVTTIEEGAFYSCYNLRTVTVSAGNTNYRAENNCLIQNDTNKIIILTQNSTIPASAQILGYGCYMDIFSYGAYGYGNVAWDTMNIPQEFRPNETSTLKQLVIPATITSMENNAFTRNDYTVVIETLIIESQQVVNSIIDPFYSMYSGPNANTIYILDSLDVTQFNINTTFESTTTDKTGYLKYVKPAVAQ